MWGEQRALMAVNAVDLRLPTWYPHTMEPGRRKSDELWTVGEPRFAPSMNHGERLRVVCRRVPCVAKGFRDMQPAAGRDVCDEARHANVPCVLCRTCFRLLW